MAWGEWHESGSRWIVVGANVGEGLGDGLVKTMSSVARVLPNVLLWLKAIESVVGERFGMEKLAKVAIASVPR